MALEVYSRTRDGAAKLSANFTVNEFACKDGSDPVFVDSDLIRILQAIRDRLQVPVILDTDAKSNCDKYVHLGMELTGTRSLGAGSTLYDLLRYPEAK